MKDVGDDIVQITTYDLVRAEHEAYETVDEDKKSLCLSPLFKTHWKRVVLGTFGSPA